MITAADVTAWLGDTSQADHAAQVLPGVIALVKGYTRGRGFDAAGEPVEDVSAVIVSVCARVIANPDGLTKTETTGPFTEQVTGWQGFTLLERLVLDRWRVKAR